MYLEELYLFIGTEQVIKKNKIDRILDNVNTEETDIIYYDLEITPIQDVIVDCMTIPFLKKSKVIICKNPIFFTNIKTSIKHDTKVLIKYLERPSDETVLIIDAVGMNIDKNSEIFKMFQKYAYIIDVKNLEQIEIKAWIKRNIESKGSTIQDEALNLLVEYIGDDLLRAENEVDKLTNLRMGERITEKDIREIVIKNYENDVYALAKALINKNNRKAIELYESLKKNVGNSTYLFSIISKSFVDIYAVKKLLIEGYGQNDISTIMGIKTGRAYYLIKDANDFSLEVLERYIFDMANIEYQIKNGMIDKNYGLDVLILKM